jgi:hypothetical protein
MGEAIFQSDRIQQRQTFGGIEVGDQIDIGGLEIGAGEGTMRAQMDDADRLGLRFMPARAGNDLVPVHTWKLPSLEVTGKRLPRLVFHGLRNERIIF